jgi:hypothetical protein
MRDKVHERVVGCQKKFEVERKTGRQTGVILVLCKGQNRLPPDSLLFQRDGILRHLIERSDSFGVGFVAALGDDQIGEFGGNVDV